MSIITAFVMIVFGGYKIIELVTSQNTAIKIYPQIVDLLKVGEGEEGRVHPADDIRLAFKLERDLP